MGESTQKVHGSSSLVRSTAIVDAVLACIASGDLVHRTAAFRRPARVVPMFERSGRRPRNNDAGIHVERREPADIAGSLRLQVETVTQKIRRPHVGEAGPRISDAAGFVGCALNLGSGQRTMRPTS